MTLFRKTINTNTNLNPNDGLQWVRLHTTRDNTLYLGPWFRGIPTGNLHTGCPKIGDYCI